MRGSMLAARRMGTKATPLQMALAAPKATGVGIVERFSRGIPECREEEAG